MDDRAISLVRTTFKAVAAVDGGPEKLAASFYAILFADNPGTRELFPAAMNLQRDRLVTAIAYVVDHLDDLDATLPFLAQLGRDHRKYGIVDEHYVTVGTALVTALRRFAGVEIWTDDVDSAWREAVAVISGAMMDAANADDGPAVHGATVVEHIEALPDLSIVRLQLDMPLYYEAGQYVSVQVPSRPRMWRYLSPAMPANPEGQIEFHVRRIPSGWVSPAVRHTQPGDRWLFGSPLGVLGTAGADGADMVMIGSGSGVAPLRAQIMEMSARVDNPSVHLFLTGEFACDLYDYPTLRQIAATNPWLTLVPVVGSDDDPWWATSSHVRTFDLPDRIVGSVGTVVGERGSWDGHDLQVVGSPSMVKSTVYRLRAAGVDTTRLRHDPLL